jgi:hypothetical protein
MARVRVSKPLFFAVDQIPTMRPSIILQRVCIVGILVVVSGCALFNKTDDMTAASGRDVVGRPPDRITRDTIQLEVLLLDRPENDPLLGRILWDDVDEIGAVELDVRERLNSNGLRVGVAGSTLPQALQTLLESSHKGLTFLPADKRRISNAPPITLLAGTDTLVTTTTPARRSITLTGGKSSEPLEFDTAVCAFRVKANRLQDGWARLEFTPEIHHGASRVRHQANDVGWEMRASQDIEVLHDQRFEVMLNVGETAVVSCGQLEADSVGEHFFSQEKGKQRLMIVRLANIGQVEGLSRRATGQ